MAYGAKLLRDKAKNSATMIEQLHIAELDMPSARVLANRASIFQDLTFCIQCCDRLSSTLEPGVQEDTVLQQALWTAALISYARCFATGVRQGLSPSIYDKFEGEPRDAHQMYIDMRNRHIAHSVNPFEQVTIGAVLAPPTSATREVQAVSTLSMKRISDGIEGAQQLRLMALTALKEMERLCKEQTDKVFEDAKKIPIDKLYARASPRVVAPEPKAAGERRIS
jgi:hypothetical protein